MDYLGTHSFTPRHRIEEILRTHFASSSVIHKFTDFHVICKFTIEDLLNANITNWEFNRPPDHIRCRDIAHYLYNSRRLVDTMFYFSFNNETHRFDVLDGVHRYTALKYLREQNGRPVDHIDPGCFGANLDANWLYNQHIIVNIRFNALESDLIETFKSLNKSNPVPDLYIRDVAKEKRSAIESVVIKWQSRFPTHFSSSNSPNKPNCNRDRFVELLDKVYDGITEPLGDWLDKRNDMIRASPPKTSQSILKKCEESGCFLFLYKFDKI